MAYKLLILPGRYSALSTPLHKINTRIKLFMFCLLSLAIVFAKNTEQLVFIFLLFFVPAFVKLKIPISSILKTLFSFVFLAAVIVILNYMSLGKEGLESGALLVAKLFYLVILSSIFTLSTMPVKFVAAIEPFFKVFKIFGISARELSFVILYSIKFVALTFDIIVETIEQMRQRGLNLLKNMDKFFNSIIENSIRKSETIADALIIRGISLDEKVQLSDEKLRTADVVLVIYVIIALTILWSVF